MKRKAPNQQARIGKRLGKRSKKFGRNVKSRPAPAERRTKAAAKAARRAEAQALMDSDLRQRRHLTLPSRLRQNEQELKGMGETEIMQIMTLREHQLFQHVEKLEDLYANNAAELEQKLVKLDTLLAVQEEQEQAASQSRARKPLHELHPQNQERRIKKLREEVDLLCERMQLPELALVLDEEAVVQGGSRSEEKAHGIERALKYKIDRLIQACQSLFVKFLPFCIYFFVASQIMDSRGGSQHLVEDLLRAAKSPEILMGKVTRRRKELNDRLRILLPFAKTEDEDNSAWVDPAQLLRFLATHAYKDAKRLEISVGFDGRSLYNYCDNVLVCLRVLVDGQDQHKRDNVWPLGMLPVKERYDELSKSPLKTIFERLGEMGKVIKIGEREVPLQLWFCSDMKAMLMALGLSRANENCS